jgi:hypothetical protein
MSRLASLFVLVALVLPGVASAAVLDENGIDQAAAHRKAVAVQQYYASHRDAITLPAPEPAATDSGGVSPSLAIGAGIALILLAGGLGVYAGRSVRPRHLGA